MSSSDYYTTNSINRTAARIVFIQYVLSSTDMHSIIETLINFDEESGIDYNNIDQDFLERLISFFDIHKEFIIYSVNQVAQFIQLDEISFAVLYAGCTEIFMRSNHRYIIRDYLTISDLFDLSSKFIHAVLNDIILIHRLAIIIIANIIYHANVTFNTEQSDI